MKGGEPERRRRAAVGLLEGGAEVTVTVEAEIEAQRGEVIVLGKQIERSCQSELHLVPIQRYALDLLKHLREVHGGMADFGADLCQCPTPSQIARQNQFGSIDEPLADSTRGRRMRRAGPQRAPCQREREALRLQRFSDVRAETVSKQRRQCLRSRVDARTLLSKRDAASITQEAPRRQFIQNRFAEDNVKAGVTAWDRVADAIAFVGVEEEDLVRLGDCIVSPKMPDVSAAIWEDDVGCVRGFLIAVMPAATRALDISDGDELRPQQRSSGYLSHVWSPYSILVARWRLLDPTRPHVVTSLTSRKNMYIHLLCSNTRN